MRTVIQRKAVYACVRVLCAALALFASSLLTAKAESDGMLRVRLTRLGAPSALTMRANCDYTLAADSSVRIPSGTTMTVSASGGSLTLTAGDHSAKLGASACLVRDGSGNQGLVFSSPALSNRFCGDLYLAASGDAIAAMLRIYIEDYLRGVVGYEMSPSSGIEALKAQAIVARNYALSQKAARNGSGYDLSDSGDALSFRGYNDASEYADAIRAVDETRGMVLCYGDSPAVCYFCDSNGGQTESSANALGHALPYSTVMDDSYDLKGGGIKKTAKLRKDGSDLNAALRSALLNGIARQLQAQGIVIESDEIPFTIEAIEPEAPRYEPPSRLYRSLAFTVSVSVGEATAHATVHVPTYGGLEDWYDLSINEDDNETVWVTRSGQSFEITFRRSGSGLGMSQRGAHAMAGKGLSFETILEYYYPGTTLRAFELSDSTGEGDSGTAKVQANSQPIATARLKQKTRLYESADTASAARTTLPAGTTVTVYAVRDEWAAIGSGKLYGFIHTDALASFALTNVTAAQVRNETFVKVSGDSVNVLQLPVKTALTIETLADGALVRLNAYTDEWALITTVSGVEGFIARESLTLQANAAASKGDDIVTAQDNLYGLLTKDAGLYVNADDSVEPAQTLEKDTRVLILAYNDAWAHVRTSEGVSGFVKLDALSAVQEVAAPGDEAEIEGGEIIKAQGKHYRYVSADALSLFKSYSTDSEILATLARGERVRLGAYNEKWACVRVQGVTGFVLLSGLSDTPPIEDGVPIEGGEIITVRGTKHVIVTADNAPLYPSWSTEETPITRLKQGTLVQLGAYNSAWACVNAEGTIGFMRVDALGMSEANEADDSGVHYRECDAVTTVGAAIFDNGKLEGVPIGNIPEGKTVHVYAYNSQRAYVEYDGQRGFVSLHCLKKK